MKKTFLLFGLGALLLWQGCVSSEKQTTDHTAPPPAAASSIAALQPALDSMNRAALLEHTQVLASDEYEGRAPGTRGEELTVNYLSSQFQKLGLKPGHPDGSYTQKVPLVGFTGQTRATFQAGGQQLEMRPGTDFVAVSRRFVPESRLENSEVVFVGYGVVAPEYGWDDFKGVDVKGKTIVMLINDPAIPDPRDPKRLDDQMFKGRAMTYYGRWTYKYEIAAERGAAAAIIIHEEGPAGYPFEVVSGSWGRENFDIQTPDKNMNRPAVEAWISAPRAQELLAAGGQDFAALKKAALSKDFRPVTLRATTAQIEVKNSLREINSLNVIARLEGSDATLKDEYVIYTAHWDHLGRDEKLSGDQIFNGALDNASGVALLLEIAKGFTKLPTPPKRSILFLAVTAEEKGLLGAKYYAEHPLYPLTKTLCNINVDGVNQWGRTSDVVLVGAGQTTLEDLLHEAAASQNRTVKPDPEPEKGFYYRSDHFEFARQGVPALYADTGTEFIGRPESYSQQKRDEYTKNDYHKVSDEVKPDWDLAGAIQDAQLLFIVGHRVAQGEQFPAWKPGAEFKAKREAMLQPAGTTGRAH